jgi:tetratricopeptide (TPR) repeat protein
LQRGDFAAADRHCAEGLVDARRADQVESRDGREWGMSLQLHAMRVEVLLQQERYADALVAIDAGLAELDARLGSVRLRFNLLRSQNMALRHLGRLEESLQAARLCLAIASDTGITRLQVVALAEIAETALLMDDLALAAWSLDEARAPAHAADLGYMTAFMLEFDGQLAWARGERARARAALEESLRLLLARGETALPSRCLLASIELEEGRIEAALARVEEVLALAAADPQPQCRAIAPAGLLTCVTVLRAAGDGRAASLLDDLRVRLDEQLAALPDADQRERLLTRVPWWRDTQKLLGGR